MPDDLRNPAQDLSSLWSTNYQRFKQSRDLIEECARWSRQEMKPSLPSRMVEGRQTPQGFPITLPHSTTMQQDVASFVARRQPSLRRVPLGQGTRAQRAASDVEEWLQAAFASKVKIDGEPLWDTLCAFATADSEFAVLVQPAPSHYSGLLNLLDDDGRIMAHWQRNADGLDADEYISKTGAKKGYRVSSTKSREARSSYARDFKAKRWPFVVRILSAPEYLPLGRDPLTGQLDTLLIRSVCTASHLEAEGFEWFSHDAGSTDPRAVTGSGESYILWELHKSDPWRIIYQIDGLDDGRRYSATKDGTPVQLGLDMAKLYGLHRLHAANFFGWHRPQEKDPAKRGIPLLAPFLGILGGAQRQITGIVEHNYRTGFGPWGFRLSPEMLEVWTELGRPDHINMLDDTIVPLLGDPVSLVHQGVGNDAWRVFEFLMGMVNQFNEGDQVRSSPDSSSIAQTTALASVDTVLSQIANGSLQAYKFTAECLLEQCSALSGKEHFGAPIPVYCHVTPEGNEQTHVELGADDLMGDFSLEINQPTKKGSNLPKAQAGVAWVDRKLISPVTWLEDFYGEEQPEKELDRIAVYEYLNGPQGQQELQTLVARIQGDREAFRIKQLQQGGSLTTGGTPSAALPPRPAGAAVVGRDGVPMTNVNPAASALGGIAASGVNPGGAQTNVVAATGTGAETSVP